MCPRKQKKKKLLTDLALSKIQFAKSHVFHYSFSVSDPHCDPHKWLPSTTTYLTLPSFGMKWTTHVSIKTKVSLHRLIGLIKTLQKVADKTIPLQGQSNVCLGAFDYIVGFSSADVIHLSLKGTLSMIDPIGRKNDGNVRCCKHMFGMLKL